MSKLSVIKSAFSFLLILLLACCDHEQEEETYELFFDYQEFMSMRKRWEESQITNYRFGFYASNWWCDAGWYYVENGKVVKYNRDTITCPNGQRKTMTVDQFFAIIEQYYQLLKPRQDCEVKMIAYYDELYGFPTYFKLLNGCIDDLFWEAYLSGFEVLEK